MLFVSRFMPDFGIIPKLPIVYINVEVEYGPEVICINIEVWLMRMLKFG